VSAKGSQPIEERLTHLQDFHPSKTAWQPLAFSKKMQPAQQTYSAYDRELLANYVAVNHFRHTLEARQFLILTDHKPITDAFQQNRGKCSTRQFNHLDCVVPFKTDKRVG
jgi:hypothetical protein